MAIGLLGSYGRGNAGVGSELDLVLVLEACAVDLGAPAPLGHRVPAAGLRSAGLQPTGMADPADVELSVG